MMDWALFLEPHSPSLKFNFLSHVITARSPLPLLVSSSAVPLIAGCANAPLSLVRCASLLPHAMFLTPVAGHWAYQVKKVEEQINVVRFVNEN